MKKSQVLIKWTGSKRVQSNHIIQKFPDKINTYYEPFLGGGSMLYTLLCSGIEVSQCKCSDLNKDLIALWNCIKNDCEEVFAYYKDRWPFEKEAYYELRDEFNKDHDPLKFFCLLRTCRNGLVRYNLKDQFTSAFHLKRNGRIPDRLWPVMKDWSDRIQNVEFSVRDYQEVSGESGDLMYLDPPYQYTRANRKSDRGEFYFGNVSFEDFWNWLRSQKCSYLLSLNGFKNDEDRRIEVPDDVYEEHVLLDNGLNMYDQLHKNRVVARDSLYIHNYEPI